METKELNSAATKALSEYMGTTAQDSVLIIADEKTRSIGLALLEAGKTLAKETLYIEMKCREVNGQEPPDAIANLMLTQDVIVCATTRSMTHTNARRQAAAAGARVGTMPGITADIMRRCFAANSNDILNLNGRLIERLSSANEITLTTEAGSKATFHAKGRKIISSSGVLTKPGDWGNIPSGEVYFAPVEGTSHGRIVCDGSIAGIGLVTQPVIIDIEKGMITNIQGGKEAEQLDSMLSKVGGKAKAVAEFGIGTNPKAEICGLILEDEKVMGTIHIAFGNNISMEGSIDVPIHIDCIVKNPTFYADDQPIMTNGKFVF